MLTIAYTAVALLAFSVLLWSIRLYREHRDVGILMVMAPLLLLWYDSLLIGIGRYLGENELHIGLSWIRYTAHLLLLPAWTIAAGSIARRAELRFSKPKWVMAIFCIGATIFVIEGVLEIITLKLYPACVKDTLRYVSYVSEAQACRPEMAGLGAKPSGPPLVATMPTFLFLILGLILLIKDRWPWLLAGSLVMLAMAFVPQAIAGPLFSNMAEPVIAVGAILTLRHYLLRRQAEPTFARQIHQK